MALLQANATVAVQRRAFDPSANQVGDPAPVPRLGAVPVYVSDRESPAPPGDLFAEYTLTVLWDERYDIREGDLLVGYNPAAADAAAPLHVQHVAASGAGGPLACRRAHVKAARFAPDFCAILRLPGGTDATAGALQSAPPVARGVPCSVVAGPRALYPFAAIPNQPVSEWTIRLPAGTDVRAHDLLSLDGGRRLYAVLFPMGPQSSETSVLAHAVLAATGGQIGDAYLRPNATISTTRPSTAGGLYGGYDARRVHIVYPQANPQNPMERLQGGVATLQVALYDLVDADIRQGDGIQILSQDGASVLPAEFEFTVGAVVRRPLPFALCEMDLITSV